MTLRKWRSSNFNFLQTIPANLVETEPLTLTSPTDAPKALGIHWDVSSDSLHLSVPSSSDSTRLTKRVVASMAAQVYDVLGLFAPYTIVAKIILQSIWKLGLSWDQDVPDDIRSQWDRWKIELEMVHQHPIARRYTSNSSPVTHCQLHGFSDASEAVYLRQVHQDGSVSVSLVFAKVRVAPLKSLTIPRAELVGAHLLAKLLAHVRQLLNIPISEVIAWTDSTIVLCWLRKHPSSLKSFASHRVASIQELLPDILWRHVPTAENPADLLSRGTSAAILLRSSLWWEGPSWLLEPSAQWPTNSYNLPTSIPETKAVILTACPTEPANDLPLWTKFSSFRVLSRVIALIRRFSTNSKTSPDKRILYRTLSSREQADAEVVILKKIQSDAYPDILQHIRDEKQTPAHHPFRKYDLSIDDRGLQLSGRVRAADSKEPKRVTPLSIKSALTQLLIQTLHIQHHHLGTSTLLAVIAETYHIPAIKRFLKSLSRSCVTC